VSEPQYVTRSARVAWIVARAIVWTLAIAFVSPCVIGAAVFAWHAGWVGRITFAVCALLALSAAREAWVRRQLRRHGQL
jgi:hypothetical protein